MDIPLEDAVVSELRSLLARNNVQFYFALDLARSFIVGIEACLESSPLFEREHMRHTSLPEPFRNIYNIYVESDNLILYSRFNHLGRVYISKVISSLGVNAQVRDLLDLVPEIQEQILQRYKEMSWTVLRLIESNYPQFFKNPVLNLNDCYHLMPIDPRVN